MLLLALPPPQFHCSWESSAPLTTGPTLLSLQLFPAAPVPAPSPDKPRSQSHLPHSPPLRSHPGRRSCPRGTLRGRGSPRGMSGWRSRGRGSPPRTHIGRRGTVPGVHSPRDRRWQEVPLARSPRLRSPRGTSTLPARSARGPGNRPGRCVWHRWGQCSPDRTHNGRPHSDHAGYNWRGRCGCHSPRPHSLPNRRTPRPGTCPAGCSLAGTAARCSPGPSSRRRTRSARPGTGHGLCSPRGSCARRSPHLSSPPRTHTCRFRSGHARGSRLDTDGSRSLHP